MSETRTATAWSRSPPQANLRAAGRQYTVRKLTTLASTLGFLSNAVLYLPLVLGFVPFTNAAVAESDRVYDFTVSWVRANPDGMAERDVIGINGRWPLPTIQAEVGERVVVKVLNNLGDEHTSLHFHGLFLRNETHMDGATHVTQCGIPPGSSFTYNFTVTQPGIYWYHSHVHGQYPDGLRGPIVIQDPLDPYKLMYNESKLITVSDWYHDRMPGLINWFMSKANPTGAEPVPNSAIWNDRPNLTVDVVPGKTYRFDVVNMGAFASQYIWFEGQNMTIIMIDGVYTQPAEASMIYLTAAQRCSFLVTIKEGSSANIPFVASMDLDLFDQIPDDWNWNATAWLVVDKTKPLPEPAILNEPFDPFDDMNLKPQDNQELLGEPSQTITLDVIMDNLGDGANYAFFNNVTYVSPKVPTLYSVMTTGDAAANPAVYGTHTHPYVLKKDEIVEIILNNLDPGKHPFHLHGHHFQTVWRSADDAGTFQDSKVTSADFAPIPMRRDTVLLYPNGNMVLRFKADNPGVWLFHCHLEWHVQSGLVATFVADPLAVQRSLTIPPDHLAACEKSGIPTKGNAAGNTQNLLDLSGEPKPPRRLPPGFTIPGLTAFFFSCLSGILGIATVAWYGFVEEIRHDSSPIPFDEGPEW
ncbi:multicopper oxidase-domain-containing protein [Podospora australis]|uniref:Multicopper oxidase-domain-containing protein n=1 Tax=Podospora australis TaxID=1536484 RepID=A0AAN6WWY0_9PEZI|nr:multicopper oxidase-domain-containing protein [Podospora australis]